MFELNIRFYIFLGESKMLPNTTEQWENDDGKSVLVKCINGTKPKDDMTEDNSTNAQNETVFQVSLNGEHVHKHFFFVHVLFDNSFLFIFRLQYK